MEESFISVVFCYKYCPISVISCKIQCDNVINEIPFHFASDLDSGDEYAFSVIKPNGSFRFNITFFTDTLFKAQFELPFEDYSGDEIKKIIVCLIPDGRVFLLLESSNVSYLLKDIKYDKSNSMMVERPVMESQYDEWITEYNYRYQIDFYSGSCGIDDCKKEESADYVIESFYESLSDGSYNKINDGGLMKYHKAAKPKKIALNYYSNRKAFSVYFWFHAEEIKAVFERFYGPHPETKVDFIIRIDPDRNKYQLSMFRYGLQEPMVLPEDCYELIVFRNKFEAFRSYNYSQASGAWIW